MTMSKEMERLNSKIVFYKRLINFLDAFNFIDNSNKYDNKIERQYIMEVVLND